MTTTQWSSLTGSAATSLLERDATKPFNSTTAAWAPRNLYTTIEDFARWDQNFYDAEAGGAELIEKMHNRGVLANGEKISYAAGLQSAVTPGSDPSVMADRTPAIAASKRAFPISDFP